MDSFQKTLSASIQESCTFRIEQFKYKASEIWKIAKNLGLESMVWNYLSDSEEYMFQLWITDPIYDF